MAIVTGAGRGIGRAHAVLLANRGASVVVNDRGATVEGEGDDTGPASEVALDITSAGGVAIADTNDVGTPSGAHALIDATVERFGRLDILVNNAGIMRWAAFPNISDDDLEQHWAVHVGGSFYTARAAWPLLVNRGFGRIVMTTSTGVLGLFNNTAYAIAKGGVIGLTRSLATAGAAHGIKVNGIAPAAVTRMAGPLADTAAMSPELVAPIVAYLAHEACPVNGEIYTAGAGRFARLFIASTDGYVAPDPTVEDVADHWAEIHDPAGYSIPPDLMAWTQTFLAHLRADD